MSATVTRSLDVAAPVRSVWDVLARYGDLARWAPTVDHSCLLDDRAVDAGTVRRVQVGRTVLLERVTRWEPPTVLGYEITGLPPVLRAVENRWEVAPARTGATVSVTTSVDVGPRPPQQLIARLVAHRLGGQSDAMLRGLAAAVTTGGSVA